MPSSAAASALAADVVPVEGQHVGEVAVQRGEHLHGSQAAGIEHAVEHHERPPGLALVDGVGELVARDVARLAEIRRQVVGGDAGALAVGGAQRAEQALDAAEVLADVAGQQVGRRAARA